MNKTQNVDITLKALLVDDWLLDAPLSKEEITILAGEPLNLKARFQPSKFSIEVQSIASAATPRNESRTRIDHVVAINIWQKITERTQTNVETAKEIQQTIVDEIRRIVKANRHTFTDVEFVCLRNDQWLNGLDQEPPYIRRILNVRCLYHV